MIIIPTNKLCMCFNKFQFSLYYISIKEEDFNGGEALLTYVLKVAGQVMKWVNLIQLVFYSFQPDDCGHAGTVPLKKREIPNGFISQFIDCFSKEQCLILIGFSFNFL